MSGLITDLLDVARIETGTLSVAPEPADVADLVDRARNTFLSAGGKNNLHIDLPPDLPMVMADKLRIAQVLANLLSNASKHSPELSVIRVSAARAGIHVAVTVADEGIGLSADRLPHLFRKFSHNRDDARPPGTASSGLGLAICKGIVETLGGRIWADSDGPGLGTRFTFTLPAVAETGYVAPSNPSPHTGPPQDGTAPASSSSMTIPTPSDTSATPSRNQATNPSSPQIRKKRCASSRKKTPNSSCSTSCCPAAAASI